MPRCREARPLAKHYSDLVRVALMEARPAGLHTYQLMAATRLARSQVGRGIRHVRDVVAAENLTPTTWTRGDGYPFTDLVDWARDRLRLTCAPSPAPRTPRASSSRPAIGKPSTRSTAAWNARRNARDYERLPQQSEAHLNWALITTMTPRLTRKSPRTSQWTTKPAR